MLQAASQPACYKLHLNQQVTSCISTSTLQAASQPARYKLHLNQHVTSCISTSMLQALQAAWKPFAFVTEKGCRDLH
jgi:hypothetical protein